MIETTLDIATPDGEMETFVCRPERGGPRPPALMLMDAPGVREELRDMARRLASVGYAVLLPNLYYRAGRDTTFGADVLEKGSAGNRRMRAIRTKMTIPPIMRDVSALIDYCDSRPEIAHGPVGCHGYCMSGPLRARGRRPLSAAYRRRRVVLRHVARERRRGKPPPHLRARRCRALYRLRRA